MASTPEGTTSPIADLSADSSPPPPPPPSPSPRADEETAAAAAAVVAAVAAETPPPPYVPPKATRVGNIRDLLAGDGGSVADADPTSQDQQSGSGG